MNSLSKEKKIKVVNDLKEFGGNWDVLLSKYDEEIFKNQKDINKLSKTLDSLKDNKSISDSISKEIENKKFNIQKIKSSKEDLIVYLDTKKSQTEQLITRVKNQKDNKKKEMEQLILYIDHKKGELEKLKKNYDVMESFLNIQENIQTEIEKIEDIILNKEKELKEKETSELLSKTLLTKIESIGGKEFLKKDFKLHKYELRKINENSYRFVDNNGNEITNIQDLGLDINRHGNYFVRKLDNNFIDIISNDAHYVYDFKNMKILGQVDNSVNIIENDGDKYVGLRDVNTFATDNEYNVFDFKTGKRILDKKIKGKPWGIRKIGDKKIIYTRTYVANKTKIHFYVKENGDEIGSKFGYMGDKIIFDLDDLLKNPISDYDKREFIKKMFSMDNIFFIDNGYGVNSISVLDSNTLEKMGDFSTKSGIVKMEDEAMVALKYIENSNNRIIFDLKEQKELSPNFCDPKYSIKDYGYYCIVTKHDGNSILLNKKTKKVLDCMGKIYHYPTKIKDGQLLLVESKLANKKINRFVNAATTEMLELSKKNYDKYDIQDFILFRSDGLSSNVIVKLKDKNDNIVYSYVNLINDIDGDGSLIIDKTYSKIERDGHEYKLSNGLFSKIRINGHGNKI